MTHSVSHSLIIECNGNRITFLTQRKDDVILEVKEYKGVAVNTLKTILGNMPEVFSEIQCCVRQKEFIVIPEEYFESEHSEIFKLSYLLEMDDQLFLDKLENGVGILYKDDVEIHNVLRSKYPRITIKHEASLILSKIQKELQGTESKLFLSINDESITIMFFKDKKIRLCNMFEAKSVHEIFYFVMLMYEQFQLLTSETELIILGEPIYKSELHELLSQYVRNISYRIEECQYEQNVTSKSTLGQSFSMQLMVCE